jgi:uncharacterized damage-inducible protein DinB
MQLRSLAHNNAWANFRLLAACAQLSQDEFEARRAGFFPSLMLTLNHILIVDRFYVDALEGGTLGPAAYANETPCRRVEELRREQVAIDRRLIAVCDALDTETVGAPVRLIRAHRVQVERADRVLLHLFQHQIHHRGQAHAMLAATPVEPPQLDEFFLAEDAPLRADDLAALTWTEDDVWGGSMP